MGGLTRGIDIVWKAAMRGPSLCAASNFRAAILAGRSGCKIRQEFEALEDIAFCLVVLHGWMAGRGRPGPGGVMVSIERRCGHFQRSIFLIRYKEGLGDFASVNAPAGVDILLSAASCFKPPVPRPGKRRSRIDSTLSRRGALKESERKFRHDYADSGTSLVPRERVGYWAC